VNRVIGALTAALLSSLFRADEPGLGTYSIAKDLFGKRRSPNVLDKLTRNLGFVHDLTRHRDKFRFLFRSPPSRPFVRKRAADDPPGVVSHDHNLVFLHDRLSAAYKEMKSEANPEGIGVTHSMVITAPAGQAVGIARSELDVSERSY